MDDPLRQQLAELNLTWIRDNLDEEVASGTLSEKGSRPSFFGKIAKSYLTTLL